MSDYYTPVYRDEIEALKKHVEDRREWLKVSGSCHVRVTLCYLSLISVFEMIAGAIACLAEGNALSYNIILRSLLEQVGNLQYIAVHDDPHIGRKFVESYRLVQYFERNKLSSFRDQIPEIESRYREYVARNINQLLKQSVIPEGSSRSWDWKSIDEKIRRKYRPRGWSGLTFGERLKAANQMLQTGLRERRFDGDPDLDVFLERAEHLFHLASNHSHPTPYSAIPHFQPKTLRFEWDYDYPLDDLKKKEGMLVWILEYAADAFANCLPKAKAKVFRKEFRRQIVRSPNINTYYFGEQ